MKHFDLNIDKILENWDLSHAVRELIANAIDESVITNTAPPEVTKDSSGWWRMEELRRRGFRRPLNLVNSLFECAVPVQCLTR
jgi:hypothetical protein